MTIFFQGNSYKYEIEAVMKLFLPLTTFSFIFLDNGDTDENSDTDTCYIIRKENENNERSLSVNCTLDGKNVIRSAVSNGDDDDELILCRMLFKCMHELTGINSEWGCLTGIRPVKKVNNLLNRGYTKDEIFEHLREKYYVSDNKLELSYQTAVTQNVYLNSLDKKSYSLYVSIPFCPSRCTYCSFVSHSIENASAKKLLPQYVEKLCEEIADTAKIARELSLKLDTIYIGGGTPTSLSAEDLEILMQNIQKNFDISAIREYTVEAGRSDTITAEKLKVIRKYGATRISINPQTMNDNVLREIGRRHTAEDVVNSFKLARSLGFDNINMDTIAGLPSDTIDGFKYTIDTLCDLDPESITIHTLTVKRSSALFADKSLRLENNISDMVSYGHDKLSSVGYLPYYLYRQKNTAQNLENVGYAKKGYESLYNIYIMEEGQTILAVGAAGSTKLVNTDTGKIERIFGYKFPYEYISKFDKMMEKKSKIAEFFSNI